MKAWDKVLLARHANRPTSLYYINNIFENFIELHGDRCFGDDKAIIAGIGTINNIAVTIIGQQKGSSTKENIYRNFGMPNPEGYRKALRMMKQAEKFGRPIITFIDTPGAYPGIGAEERGQGEAIARNIMEMSGFSVPIISIIIGEGSSGGALGLGVGNSVIMLENAIYSILSPEGFATILWKDASRAEEVAEIMKITAKDLKTLGIVDKIIKEPEKGAHTNPEEMSMEIKKVIKNELQKLNKLSKKELVEQRIEKYRNIGEYKMEVNT